MNNFNRKLPVALNPTVPLVYYFPTIAASELKKAAFFGAGKLFDLIPIDRLATDFTGAFTNATPDKPDYTGTLGLPVYGSILFGNTDIHDKTGNQYTGIDGQQYTFDNLQVDCCLVTCDQVTNIVKAKITGRPGAIKEYIGLDDWKINIMLILDNEPLIAPTEFMRNMYEIKQAQVSIPVTNYYLNALDIYFIVIENIAMHQEVGKYSSQTVTITACSDIPLANFLP